MNRFARLVPLLATLLATLVVGSGCADRTPDLPDGLYARIETSRGTIIARLEPERAPVTVMNFVGLAEGTIDNSFRSGSAFYDGLTFHRVEPNFVIQGGDPNGTGTGGPGYRFPTETHEELLHDSEGILAMANSGPDTNGSQFYITLRPTPHLDGGYNVFGSVVDGMDAVRAIQAGDVMRRVTILRIGEAARAYTASTEAFDRLVDELLERREQEAVATRAQAIARIEARWPDAVEYGETGMYLAQIADGAGGAPEPGQRVGVHFVLSLVDGTQIESTRDRGEPYRFNYLQQRLVEGLEIAIGTMGVGARIVAVVPPELGWGPAGIPPVIPANSYIVFEVERLE
ncbi:MAG: peptidylprolyl isomerase [Spirochaetaceae bacterium]|nr:MAG: peptidylprolyl isomerase [Spirochaetaceae bacterium]